MGASSSIDSIPQRHIHVTVPSGTQFDNRISILIERLTSYHFAVSKTNQDIQLEHGENIIDKSHIVLHCVCKKTISSYSQLREIDIAKQKSKQVVCVVLEDLLEGRNIIIDNKDNIEYKNTQQIDNVITYLGTNFAKIDNF